MWHSLFPSQNDLREITRTCIILGHLLNISAYQGTDSCVCMGVRCKDDYTMFLLSVLPWNKFQPFKITKGRNLNHLTVSSSCLGCSRLTVSACWVNAWNGHSVVQHWCKLKASPSTQMHGARLVISLAGTHFDQQGAANLCICSIPLWKCFQPNLKAHKWPTFSIWCLSLLRNSPPYPLSSTSTHFRRN